MIPRITDSPCLWERLQTETRPIFLYGTGNGGDKIIAALERYGVSLTGVFASDGFVRSRTFHDFPVQAYSDVVAQYGNAIVVLLAFGTTLPEVRTFIEALNARHSSGNPLPRRENCGQMRIPQCCIGTRCGFVGQEHIAILCVPPIRRTKCVPSLTTV